LQAAYLGLAKALKTFDPKKGTPLKYWIYRITNSEIIKARYKNSKEYRETNNVPSSFFNEIEDNKTPLTSLIEKELNEEKLQRAEHILKILDEITENKETDKNIYIDHILNGQSIKTLVTKYNLTYPAITHRCSNLTQKIREKIKEEELCKIQNKTNEK
jgi:DNA-directed RNA polymerase specialized sigma24 family protein